MLLQLLTESYWQWQSTTVERPMDSIPPLREPGFKYVALVCMQHHHLDMHLTKHKRKADSGNSLPPLPLLSILCVRGWTQAGAAPLPPPSLPSPPPPYRSSVPEVGPRQGQFRVHILQIPLEGLATQCFPELESVTNIPVVPLANVWSLGVVILLVVVHPCFNKTHVVLSEGVTHTPWERVGVPCSEYVAHMGAGDDFQLPPAHPDLENVNISTGTTDLVKGFHSLLFLLLKLYNIHYGVL